MRKILLIIPILVLILMFTGACGNAEATHEQVDYSPRPVVTAEPLSADTEQEIWDYIVGQYGNQYAAAALMGNSDYEMAFCSYRTEGDWAREPDGSYPFSLEYTAKVDSGEVNRADFSSAGPNGGGYGLFAWTSAGRKEGLYDLAVSRGVSVSDWQLQLDYAYQEIVERYHALYCILMTADNLRDATWAFGYYFEQPINFEASVGRRVEIAQEYYNKYADHAFICVNRPDTLLPVNGSFDYLEHTYVENDMSIFLPVYMAQQMLVKMGYMKDAPSGYLGPKTAAAIESLQFDYNLALTGELDPDVWRVLYEENTRGVQG